MTSSGMRASPQDSLAAAPRVACVYPRCVGWNGECNVGCSGGAPTDASCPVCLAMPDQACVTPDGKPRNDHKARHHA